MLIYIACQFSSFCSVHAQFCDVSIHALVVMGLFKQEAAMTWCGTHHTHTHFVKWWNIQCLSCLYLILSVRGEIKCLTLLCQKQDGGKHC